ncbi:DUF3106 domain-containing protein [Actimicrobium sp. CCC2.4]|uniref:DUF3106 domain-containing protein n=1 Tax=Actimicrobium sp. CCC2.4 TaxID=3048606 RepID=UPI002AC94430|nr:DUF3106 domain-containing protein [Actimicrobium sp. CCC2.4]MEB0135654.1 DUF3106 domain-containing protein [Actimicrobium sp. CCC2.4]WPX33784.1 DUF3106 domain-containing protein [Actimicrobium sp. CCC2.4]
MTMSNGKRWLVTGLLACATLAGLAAVAVPLVAKQPEATSLNPGPATPAAKSVEPDTRPRWNELTPTQQNALAPLAADWNKIEIFRKKKWMEIGNRFNGMNPDEQGRVQERMREWAKLTPDERRVAREIYVRTKKLDATQKSAQWQEYQQLTEDQKKKLAADVPAKKRVSNLPISAPGSTPAAAPKRYEKAVTNKPAMTPSSAAEVAPLAVPQTPAPAAATTR